MSEAETDEKLYQTLKAGVEKLRSLNSHGHKPKYLIVTSNANAQAMFARLNRRWWQFWIKPIPKSWSPS